MSVGYFELKSFYAFGCLGKWLCFHDRYIYGAQSNSERRDFVRKADCIKYFNSRNKEIAKWALDLSIYLNDHPLTHGPMDELSFRRLDSCYSPGDSPERNCVPQRTASYRKPTGRDLVVLHYDHGWSMSDYVELFLVELEKFRISDLDECDWKRNNMDVDMLLSRYGFNRSRPAKIREIALKHKVTCASVSRRNEKTINLIMKKVAIVLLDL